MKVKIEAEAVTKNVRSKIKSYIHEKQNLREGFKETFKPLIESQDKVKESVDKEQNELIKQLQKNQLALTEGLGKNRVAITQGFDKMDEVKKWDLQQLPGYEAVEGPEETEAIEEEKETEAIQEYEENPQFLISFNDIAIINGDVPDYEKNDGEQLTTVRKKTLDAMLSQGNFNEVKYEINFIDHNRRILKVVEKDKKDSTEETKKGIVTFDDSDLDKGLL